MNNLPSGCSAKPFGSPSYSMTRDQVLSGAIRKTLPKGISTTYRLPSRSKHGPSKNESIAAPLRLARAHSEWVSRRRNFSGNSVYTWVSISRAGPMAPSRLVMLFSLYVQTNRRRHSLRSVDESQGIQPWSGSYTHLTAQHADRHVAEDADHLVQPGKPRVPRFGAQVTKVFLLFDDGPSKEAEAEIKVCTFHSAFCQRGIARQSLATRKHSGTRTWHPTNRSKISRIAFLSPKA